jgi:CheY-like chemotaxis protein
MIASAETSRPVQVLEGDALRRELIAAIEALNPGTEVSFRSPTARLYNLPHLHYVEGMTVQEAARELGLSLRQAYRDLRKSEEGLASRLWAQYGATARAALNSGAATNDEMNQFTAHPLALDVRTLFESATKTIGVLRQKCDVPLDITLPPAPVTVICDPLPAQQIVTYLLSQVIQQAAARVQVELVAAQTGALVRWRLTIDPQAARAPLVSPAILRLIERLGWEWQEDAAAEIRATLRISGCRRQVLVVDDNAGLVTLIERYLAHQACQVIAAANGREGLRIAQQILPDVILLDVMMPEMDGWEMLQRLRTSPATASIPVIVCSVFHDPELATSLGASLAVPKPVRPDDLQAALHTLGLV